MGNTKKSLFLLRRSGFFNVLISVLLFALPLVLLRSVTYSFVLLVVSVLLSTLNILQIQGKNINSLFYSKSKREDVSVVEPIVVVQFGAKFVTALLCSIFIFHVTTILFGAPVIQLFYSTLYFSCFMTMITAFPFLSHAFINGSGIIDTLLTLLECKHNLVESHLHTMSQWSIIGAWFGAIPIPLDWDRPWQEWPTTCCIGAVLGYAAAHMYIGVDTLCRIYKEKKKLPWNVFV